MTEKSHNISQLRPKEEIRDNVVQFKTRVKDFITELEEQKKDFLKAQARKERLKEMKKTMEKSIKSYSFNSVISKPPFVSQIKREVMFDKRSDVFMDTGKAMDYTNRANLIVPDRTLDKRKNFANRNVSDPYFGIIPIERLSTKERERTVFWEKNYESLREKQLELEYTRSDGLRKFKILKELSENRTKDFLPNKFNLNYFDPKPSNISDEPITPCKRLRMITLPRNYESKVWVPNKNSLDYFSRSLVEGAN